MIQAVATRSGPVTAKLCRMATSLQNAHSVKSLAPAMMSAVPPLLDQDSTHTGLGGAGLTHEIVQVAQSGLGHSLWLRKRARAGCK